MKKALYLCFLLSCFTVQWACSSEDNLFPSSRNSVLLNENKLQDKWNLYLHHLDSDPDSAFFYAYEVERLAEVENNKKWQAKSSEGIAYILFSKSQFGEAVYHYLKAAKLYKELGELYTLADIYNSLGGQYSRVKDHKNALSYFKLAKDIYDYEGTSADKAMIHRNLAVCYKELEDLERAEHHLNSGIEIALKANDYLSVVEAYNTWGTVNSEQKEFDTARKHLQLAIKYADSSSASLRIKAMAINNIGETYLVEGNYTEAKKWLDETLVLKKELGDPISAQYTYNLLAQLLIKEGQYPEAIALLEEGLQKIDSTVVDKAVGEGLILITRALNKASESNNVAQHPYLIEKFRTYSASLSTFNNNLSGTKEQMEVISQQKAVQAAAERYAFNQQLEASQEANAQMRYAFLIPIFFLIIAIVSVYLAVKRNMHYKKLYSSIEQVLNNSKALRHLK